MNQTTKLGLMVVLMLSAAGVFYYDSLGDKSLHHTSSLLDARTTYSPLPVENPELRRWKLDASRRTEYKSSGRDLFSEVLPPPPAPKVIDPPRNVGPQLPVEPPPPTLPPNMKYYGYGVVPNGTSRRAFLSEGEEIFIVAEGDTLLGRFRIVRIGNDRLEFEELSSGRRNSINLDEQGAPPA